MKQSALGIISLVLGIIGMLLSCVVIGVVPCAIALIIAIIAFSQKDRGHGTAIAGLVCSVIGIGIFLLEVFILGTSKTESSTISNMATISESSFADESDVETTQESDLASQMEVAEYSMENSIGDMYYILVVKNNSSETIELNVNAIAKDATGKTIGATTSSESAIESGQEACLLNYFDGVKDVDKFEYTLSVKRDKYRNSAYSDLSIEESRTDRKIILTVTNIGDKPAEFVQANALFFFGEELVGYGSTYITDDESEIKPGATISKEIDSYEEYDDVKVYFSGRN